MSPERRRFNPFTSTFAQVRRHVANGLLRDKARPNGCPS